MQPRHQTHDQSKAEKMAGRRDFLRGVSLAGLAAGSLGWSDVVSLRADELKQRGMSCILLWMQGGPSQFETLSPKPGNQSGGETKAIATSVPGIEITENLPKLAKTMDDWAVIRSMTSREGSHPRATSLLHTGYLPTASIKHPTLGSLVCQQRRDDECELPSFVYIGGRGRNLGGSGGGFLGVDYDPFVVANPSQAPSNSKPTTETARYQRRLGLLDRLQADYAADGGKQLVEDHKKLYDKASKMILSPQMTTFDLSKEPRAMREAYGSSAFGSGCLLARRLVESGVTFVEVALGNWDTHQDNFDRTTTLCGSLDQPAAQLITDLKQRGLLDRTLVVWMGEFGRTPRIKPRGGRDHYPRAFNVALAGGGVKGGQVIGATDPSGASVKERPVTVSDLFQSFCKALDMDSTLENMSAIGRPMKVVDGGEPVKELFG